MTGKYDENRRESDRMKVRFKVSVSIDEPAHGRTLIAPAIVHDISRGGLLIETRQTLSPGQRVSVSIPTEICPDRLSLPRALSGHADVVHARHGAGHRSHAGLRFGESLRHLPEFAAFLDYLSMSPEPLLA
ncbi:MAG TPA: PilZ domain-containing protein [Candidatus Hydrogenedentes bacterium]|nr:PilZ domain-containing protein [Candidatus Hydrogenedentota bacterium]HOV73765.1 PilZ domain-containing protein [Candidatus Hydrogenedentota bacterium]HPC18269.1 PilZ domain-containing protein [Candidatus Hydrogenedentota bacterium]HRT20560.1 PilZ domain-containing protein [Candidatus Hydrogenedentota bacterium]HRT65235.1 PilZ domain-containing protein [Candidatus Hydrogenedentota bacterium]